MHCIALYPVARQNFVRLYQMNDVDKGGSFYLQSKIFRAKERVEAEMQERGIAFEPIEIPKPEAPPAEEGEADAAETKPTDKKDDKKPML